MQIYYICTTDLHNVFLWVNLTFRYIMATVKAMVRSTARTAKVRFRLSDGRKVQFFIKSGIEVPVALWDDKNECIRKRAVFDDREKARIASEIAAMKERITEAYEAHKHEGLTSEILEIYVYGENEEEAEGFFPALSRYTEEKKADGNDIRRLGVLRRALLRYQAFTRLTADNSFTLDFGTFTPDFLDRFERFMKDEHALSERYPETYGAVLAAVGKDTRAAKERGGNVISCIMKKLRAFSHWSARKNGTPDPFTDYHIKAERYGTPYYITTEERNMIAEADLSKRPALAVQRDIFVFHCCIGCRVSDLYSLTEESIINGAVEYIPRKTKGERPETVRVPLNERARALVERYKGVDKAGRLFPFISQQKYNEAIKEIFTLCGVTRLVTVLDTVTGEEVKRPINELASSHLARRTFIGNIYKQVKDPNLVGALSGHKEGSKAFARYREIDDDIKKELVSLIE